MPGQNSEQPPLRSPGHKRGYRESKPSPTHAMLDTRQCKTQRLHTRPGSASRAARNVVSGIVVGRAHKRLRPLNLGGGRARTRRSGIGVVSVVALRSRGGAARSTHRLGAVARRHRRIVSEDASANQHVPTWARHTSIPWRSITMLPRARRGVHAVHCAGYMLTLVEEWLMTIEAQTTSRSKRGGNAVLQAAALEARDGNTEA